VGEDGPARVLLARDREARERIRGEEPLAVCIPYHHGPIENREQEPQVLLHGPVLYSFRVFDSGWPEPAGAPIPNEAVPIAPIQAFDRPLRP